MSTRKSKLRRAKIVPLLFILGNLVLPGLWFHFGWNYKDSFIERSGSRENAIKSRAMPFSKDVIIQDESVNSQPFTFVAYGREIGGVKLHVPSLLLRMSRSYAPTINIHKI
jgi:hypothetical protein